MKYKLSFNFLSGQLNVDNCNIKSIDIPSLSIDTGEDEWSPITITVMDDYRHKISKAFNNQMHNQVSEFYESFFDLTLESDDQIWIIKRAYIFDIKYEDSQKETSIVLSLNYYQAKRFDFGDKLSYSKMSEHI